MPERLFGDRSAIDLCAVGAVEVDQLVAVSEPKHIGVERRDIGLGKNDIALGRAAYGDQFFPDLMPEKLLAGFSHHDTRHANSLLLDHNTLVDKPVNDAIEIPAKKNGD